MTDGQPGVRQIKDSEVLKILAQPIRQKLWRMLLLQGPATVGSLAKQLDADPGQVSYHLRELARGGWVERAPELARDRRESWWRAVDESTAWRTEDFPTAEETALMLHLGMLMLREDMHQLQASMRDRPQRSPQWRDATCTARAFLHLTADEAQEMNAELTAVLTRWAQHGDRARAQGDTAGRRPYFVVMYGVPEESAGEVT